MTVQTFIPNGAPAASENTVTQPAHTPVSDASVKNCTSKHKGVR